jgi:HSP20 family protein
MNHLGAHTMYRSLFPRDLFGELDRLQRDLNGHLEPSPSIRGLGRGGYPALNVGSTPGAIELYAFAPGWTRPASS